MTATLGSGGMRRYTSTAQALHWLAAALILAAVVLAWVFMGMPAAAAGRFVYITLHKSFGQTIFLLALFRLIWRRLHPPPRLDGGVAAWEARTARVNHWLLYSIMIFMPVSGYILAIAAARPSPYFWLFYWPQPTLSPNVTHAALRVHLIGQFFIYALVGLHLAGVVWHAVVRRDGTLERMLPAQSKQRADAASGLDDTRRPNTKTIDVLRSYYEDAVLGLRGRVTAMRDEGASSQVIARAVHAERRRLAAAFKELTAEPLRSWIYDRTVAVYGDPIGPTIETLRAQGKSWDDIIESATRPGPRPSFNHGEP